MAKLNIPSIFTMKRSIQSSDGVFYSGRNLKIVDGNIVLDNVKNVLVKEIGIKASKSNYENDENKIADKLHESNLQRIEMASLDSENDWLQVSYNVNFTNQLKPYSCNDVSFSEKINEFINLYSEQRGFSELIERYLINIISSIPMWRNRDFASEGYAKVEVNEEVFIFKLDLHTDELDVNDLSDEESKSLNELVDFVLKKYKNKKTVSLDVTNYLKLGNGQEVFPSQEFVDDKSKADNDPSRILASTVINGKRVAVYHNAKIGNAIRRIDNWYGKEGETVYKVPVEPFAPEQNKALVHRVSNNFYKLIESNLEKYMKLMESDNIDSQSLKDIDFIMACFIRGGVFNGPKKNTDSNKK